MAAPEMQRTPTACGALSERPFEQLVVYVERNGLTGSIVLSAAGAGAHVATVDFRAGCLYKIDARAPCYLGGVLYELGLLDSADLNVTLAETVASRRLHGVVLRERGTVSQAELEAGLREQLHRKLASLVDLPRDTTWAYFDGAALLDDFGGSDGPEVSPFPGLWRGLRDATHDEACATAIGQVGARTLTLTGDGTAHLGLAPEVARLAARLVEPRTLDQLSVESGATEQVVRRLVYLLLLARRLTLRAVGDTRGSVPRMPVAAPDGPQHKPSFQFHVPVVRPPSSDRKIAIETPPGGTAKSSGVQRVIPAPPTPTDSERELTSAMSHFEALEVAHGAPTEEVRAAYFRLSRLYHPDKLPSERSDDRERYARIFARIDDAYRTLTDPSARARYMASAAPRPAARAKPIIEARAHLNRGDFAGAARACERGLGGADGRAEPEEIRGDLLAIAAWARANLVSGDIEAGLVEEVASLDRAIEIATRSADALYYRAEINKRLGRPMHALRDLRAALEINPSHVDAAREMRLFHLRVEKGMSKERALSPAEGVKAVRPSQPGFSSASTPSTSSALTPTRRDSVREKLADWLKK